MLLCEAKLGQFFECGKKEIPINLGPLIPSRIIRVTISSTPQRIPLHVAAFMGESKRGVEIKTSGIVISEGKMNISKKMLRRDIKDLVNLSNKMPDDNVFALFKVIAAYELIEYSEKYIFSEDKDPVPKVMELIDIFKDIFKRLVILGNKESCSRNRAKKDISHTGRRYIEEITGRVYGDIWKEFDKDKFYNETFKSLTDRLDRNNVDTNWFKGKICLDAGCGGGRYSIALSKFGIKKVVGLDISKEGLKEAGKRSKEAGAKNVYFKKGNVLKIPFPEGSFDFVMSNGVLHHTVDTEKGIKEISRVLKGGGKIFLYLEGKGGLYNELIKLGRKLVRNIPKEKSIMILKLIGLPGNRIFYFIDFLYVVLQNWSTPKETEGWLKKYGFANIKRLYRGTDYDRNEALFNPEKKTRYSRLIHGHGDLRYMAEKDDG